ncbi:MAG: hypothetical protein K0S74_1885, partial [Chlamydiales bacterium]|nr:hypothetical protein [Chlamydiales bacterium]
VEGRRKEIGLNSLTEYMESIKNMYNAKTED